MTKTSRSTQKIRKQRLNKHRKPRRKRKKKRKWPTISNQNLIFLEINTADPAAYVEHRHLEEREIRVQVERSLPVKRLQGPRQEPVERQRLPEQKLLTKTKKQQSEVIDWTASDAMRARSIVGGRPQPTSKIRHTVLTDSSHDLCSQSSKRERAPFPQTVPRIEKILESGMRMRACLSSPPRQ